MNNMMTAYENETQEMYIERNEDDGRSFVTDPIGVFFKEAGRHKLLSAKEEAALFTRVAAGDLKARTEAANANLRLVASIAKGYSRSYVDMDLIQAGSVGLMRAIDRFDVGRGNKFSTFATSYIKAEILSFIDRSCKAQAVSLDDSIGDDDDATMKDFLEDKSLPEMGESLEKEGFETTLREILATFPENEAKYIAVRFGFFGEKPHDIRACAKILGITADAAVRLEQKVVRKLKHPERMKRFEGYRFEGYRN